MRGEFVYELFHLVFLWVNECYELLPSVLG
ncbi:MAG: hypothetical protein A4E74_01250 [Syntrophus sp. PtaB.Bin075]|nr:MAG: hypothetical protein A4E74_01250 [Syntrophus sp. PtaB.Bin075]